MRTHQDIDRRSLQMVRRIVAKIDADPERRGLVSPFHETFGYYAHGVGAETATRCQCRDETPTCLQRESLRARYKEYRPQLALPFSPCDPAALPFRTTEDIMHKKNEDHSF